MPMAHIYLVEGRSESQIRNVIKKVTEAIAESTDSPPEAIRVVVQEIPNTNWGKAGVPIKDFGR
jgi:4-oxalocrotonate tautomerase